MIAIRNYDWCHRLYWTILPITILKSIDHNFELEQDLEVDNRRLSIVVSNSEINQPNQGVGTPTQANQRLEKLTVKPTMKGVNVGSTGPTS